MSGGSVETSGVVGATGVVVGDKRTIGVADFANGPLLLRAGRKNLRRIVLAD